MCFCYVPAGPFWLGDEGISDDEKPAHQVDIPYGYWLGQYPVTNEQFMAFVTAGGYGEAAFWAEAEKGEFWQGGRFKGRWDDEWRNQPADFGPPFTLANHPAVGVSWYEALAFGRWLAHTWQDEGRLPAGWQAQLPSEAEWEKGARGGLAIPAAPLVATVGEGKMWPQAATGSDRPPGEPEIVAQENPEPQRRFPWGDEDVTTNHANYEDTKLNSISAPGCFPAGASPYGCLEMSGNVWEWTRSHYAPYPYDPRDGREELAAGSTRPRVLRGGAFYSDVAALRCASRDRNLPYLRRYYFGFRLVVSPFSFSSSGL